MSGISNPFATIVDGAGVRQSFRGLHLRTHPDADKAATQVMLVHADEIVLSDGTRITPTDGLLANLAVAGGIGGLRSGQTEAASTWYKILIGKGATGTGLWLEQAKDHFLDETQTAGNTAHALRYNATLDSAAQTFLTDVTGPVPFIDAAIDKIGTPTGRLWFELRTTSGGVPTTTVLATSDKFDISAFPGTANVWFRFIFRTPVTLTAGTTYALAAVADSTVSTTNYARWGFQNTDVYARGALYSGTNAGVYSINTYDAQFKIYITRNDNTPAPPSGYDAGYAQIGWAYNDASSNFTEFNARAHTVTFKVPRQLLAAGGATVQTLLDATIASPPVPVRITLWELSQSTAGGYIRLSGSMGATAGALHHEFGTFYQGAAGYYVDVGASAPIEHQHLYYSVSGGTADVLVRAFEW